MAANLLHIDDRQRRARLGPARRPGARPDAAAVAASAAELEAWLGPTRITPRFPTPLQKELST